MNKEEIRLKVKNSNNGFTISNDINYQTGKVIINEIEITDIETWNKAISKQLELQQENKQLKDKLEVPENCTLKTLDDYKDYYQDTTKEHILNDTYIDYCAYVNLAKRYSNLQQENKQLKEIINKIKELMEQNKCVEEIYRNIDDYLSK